MFLDKDSDAVVIDNLSRTLLQCSYVLFSHKFLKNELTGYALDGYSIRIGVSTGVKDMGFSFSLTTPERIYHLSAQTEADRDQWIEVIGNVISRQMTPQESASKFGKHY